jgi:hypothetical protein
MLRGIYAQQNPIFTSVSSTNKKCYAYSAVRSFSDRLALLRSALAHKIYRISDMGNNKSSGTIDVLRASRPGEWVKEGSTGYCEIVRSTLTGQTAEQYSVPVDGRLSQ